MRSRSTSKHGNFVIAFGAVLTLATAVPAYSASVHVGGVGASVGLGSGGLGVSASVGSGVSASASVGSVSAAASVGSSTSVSASVGNAAAPSASSTSPASPGAPGASTSTSVSTATPATVAQFDGATTDEKVAVKKRCVTVLQSPAYYDAQLISLCRLLAWR